MRLCAYVSCGAIFVPSTNARENFGKFCSKQCYQAGKTVVPPRAPAPPPDSGSPRRSDGWRDRNLVGTKVYLFQETSVMFEILHAERGIAWVKPFRVNKDHSDTCRYDCLCQGEKLVYVSRCDLARE